MFSIKKKAPPTPSDQKLEEIKNFLFPPLKLEEENGTKFHVDYSIDSNLEAALVDLEEGNNDEVTRKTIRGVANQLFRLRKMLEAYMQIDDEAKYIIVDNRVEDPEIEAEDRR